MNKLTLALIAVIFVLIGATSVMTSRYRKVKEDRNRIESNFKESKKSWREERGYYVETVSTLRTTNQEIQDIFRREKSTIVNNYEKRIYAFKDELKNLRIEVKHLRGIISSGISVVDTVIIEVTKESDTLVSGSYQSEHLDAEIKYFPPEKVFSLDYHYRDSINVLKVVSAKPRKDGTPRKLFPNWLWLWGEQEEYVVYSKNKKSTVSVNIITEIEKR